MPTTKSPTLIGRKKCTNCKKVKSMDSDRAKSQFYKNASLKEHPLHKGFAMWCKDCDKAGKVKVSAEPAPEEPSREPDPEVTPVLESAPYIPTNAEALRMATGMAERFLAEADGYRKEVEALKDEDARKHETIIHLTNEIKRLNDKVKDGTNEAEWRKRLDDQRQQIEQLTAKVTQLTTELDQAKQVEAMALKENQELTGKVNSLNQQLDLREMRIRELEEQQDGDDAPVSADMQDKLSLLGQRGGRR